MATILTSRSTPEDAEIYVPEELQSLMLSFLPISSLFQIQSVCKLWQKLSTQILDFHHNKFTSRIKLYSVILRNRQNDDDCWFEQYENGQPMLASELEHVNKEDSIYPKYRSLDINYDYTEEDYQDNEQNNEEDYQDNEDYNDNEEPCQACYHSQFLEGTVYEYPYEDDNISDIKLKCYVCNQTAFLPVMVKYTATFKDRRSDSRYYFDGYATVCRQCVNNRKSIGDKNVYYPMQSACHEDVNIVIGLRCIDLEEYN